MSNEIAIILKDCPRCLGTGIDDNGEHGPSSCLSCGGDGKLEHLVSMLPDDVYPTYKILEATDVTEYTSLAPGNVALYNLIISAGTIDLGETTMALAVLFGMFGPGTTTRTNLLTLIGD